MRHAHLPPSPPLPRCAPEVADRGFYLVLRADGFVLHMSAGPDDLREMRDRVYSQVLGSGASEEIAEAARLLASELVGNAVRWCGSHAPVVVKISGLPREVVVRVHDPAPDAAPRRRSAAPDNAEHESGRGLWILDALAPGWTVEPTSFGKQICCRLSKDGVPYA
ncbi:ATP-binding protein [Streptomyces sp. NPDC047046]|uniref:ATP-binding protein n=1 Tax=Streptomyces sp. NPDC047046 TaxID=3155378 RepID=UPI0033D82222